MIITESPDPISEILAKGDLESYLSHLIRRSTFGIHPQGIDYTSLSHGIAKCTFFGKIGWIKRWFISNADGFAAGIKLSFPLRSAYGCHMDDAGNVRFPWSAFRKRFDCVVKYVFHESAHLILSKWDAYPALLSLDRAFLARHRDSKVAAPLSPIEYLATTLSIEMLGAAADHLGEGRLAGRLISQREKESEKLTQALGVFTEEYEKTSAAPLP